MIEPSDAERATWPEATENYVAALEARVAELERLAFGARPPSNARQIAEELVSDWDGQPTTKDRDIPVLRVFLIDRIQREIEKWQREASFAIGGSKALIESAVGRADRNELDARRYRFLRTRDLETIGKGGIFAGLTPENLVLNGEDLDKRIDAAMADGMTFEEIETARISQLEGALEVIRAAITNENGLNGQSIVCTVWVGQAETAVDFIDATLNRPEIRHKKRGGTYRVAGTGRLQTDRPLEDYCPLVAYRGDDGALWFRPPEEVVDGRFEVPPDLLRQVREN